MISVKVNARIYVEANFAAVYLKKKYSNPEEMKIETRIEIDTQILETISLNSLRSFSNNMFQ